MGTRAVFTFKDADSKFHVYKHWDCYPSGAVDFIHKAAKLAWPLPRFEADEFATSFIAANKNGSGDVRLTKSPSHHGDIEYIYEVSFSAGQKALWVECYAAHWDDDRNRQVKTLLCRNTFEGFRRWVESDQEAA